ncbi:Glutamine-rich protein 2 [Vespula squamosa]|uniref:Glutamine-rich protein 2 n=1 Tax=Vespula squamosa TaxID=30214 RepID=A0ABD2A7N6_VESSQ
MKREKKTKRKTSAIKLCDIRAGRPCQAMPGHARACQAMPGYARPGQTRPGHARPDQTRPANRSSKQGSKLPKLRRKQSPVNVVPYGPPPPLHPFPCLRTGVIDGCPSLQRSHVPRLGNRQLRYRHVSVSYTDYSCFLISLQIVIVRNANISRVLREAGIKEEGREKFRKIYETLGHFGAQRENGRREP